MKKKDFFSALRKNSAIAVEAASKLRDSLSAAELQSEVFSDSNQYKNAARNNIREAAGEFEKTFITPFPAELMLDMLFEMKNFLDKLCELSEEFWICKIQTIKPGYRELSERLNEIAEEFSAFCDRLHSYKHNREKLEQRLLKIEDLCGECEELYINKKGDLFNGSFENPEVMLSSSIFNAFISASRGASEAASRFLAMLTLID